MVAAGCIFINSHGLDECGVLPDLNKPPVANAGDDQNFDCASALGLEVDLDGFGSSDPDNDELTFLWTEEGAVIASGITPSVMLLPGVHTINLTVDDGNGETATDEVLVYVMADTENLVLAVTRGVITLWPPNHKYVTISLDQFELIATDNCSVDPNSVFDLAEETFAQLKIFDVSGRLIKTLASQNMAEGEQRYNWNAEDDHGNHVTNGLYFVVLVTKNEVSWRALVLAR